MNDHYTVVVYRLLKFCVVLVKGCSDVKIDAYIPGSFKKFCLIVVLQV